MQRLIAGEVPTDEELAEYLVAFHRDVPAATPSVFGRLRDGQGRTSYEIIARRCALEVREGAAKLLDVGCGDGAAVPALRTALPAADICGIDLSAEEIARARAAYADARTSFVQARAQRLPFAAASFDAAVSHMALMLVQPVSPAFAELARVLRPGASLTFVIGTLTALSGDLAALISAAQRFMHGRFPGLIFRSTGDARMNDETGLRDVLAGNGLKLSDCTDFEVSGDLSAQEVLGLFEKTYVFGSLHERDRDLLHAELCVRFCELAAGRGTVHVRMPLRLGSASAAGH